MSVDPAEPGGMERPPHIRSRDYIGFLIERAKSDDEVLYRLTFESGIGVVVWEKTAAELLQPNGDEPLIAYMLRECDRKGYQTFKLEQIS